MTGKYTAIARRKPSSPMILLRDEIFGECLDYGCGRGFDCDYFGIDGYDPNWRRSQIMPIILSGMLSQLFQCLQFSL